MSWLEYTIEKAFHLLFLCKSHPILLWIPKKKKKKEKGKKWGGEGALSPVVTTRKVVSGRWGVENFDPVNEWFPKNLPNIEYSTTLPQDNITPNNQEKAIKEFMQSSLKIPQATVNEITFHSVHHLTFKDNKKPPPIMPVWALLYKHKKMT